MKLEDQVTNLELSKKLKELGVKQESLWYWNSKDKEVYYRCDFVVFSPTQQTTLKKSKFGDEPFEEWFSAFTVAELGEMLPKGFATHVMLNGIHKEKWRCLSNLELSEKCPELIADTEANARAKTLIYLIENKLI